MIRRKLTLKRVDPWTVLKFGFVVNLVLLLVGLLAFWVIWVIIGRLGLIEQFCGSVGTIVLDLQDCGLNGGNIFRTLLFLGVLGVIVQTGIFVLFAFLYNLIADLTGGLGFTYLDESSDAVAAGARSATPREQTGPDEASGTGRAAGTGAVTGAPSGAVASSRPAGSNTAASPSTAPGQRSTPGRPAQDGPPQGPPQRPEQSSAARPTSVRDASPSSDRRGEETTTNRHPSERQESSDERPSGSLWNDPTRVQRRD